MMNDEIQELFLNCPDYKEKKALYEKSFFKLRGEFCEFDGKKVINYSLSSIASHFNNKRVSVTNEVIEETTAGKTKSTKKKVKEITRSFYDVWKYDPDMLEYNEITFEPNTKLCDKKTFNLFRNFSHFDHLEKKELNLEPVFDHIRSIVGYNEEVFNYMIAWLSHIIQCPWELPHKCPVIISEVGVGKDELFNYLECVIGEDYCLITDKIDNVCGKFNNLIAGKFLIVLNETNPADTKERIENIKSIVTAKKVVLEAKYKDAVKTNNYARIMFFSNRLFCFPIEAGARRPMIVKSSIKYLAKEQGGTLTAEEKHKHFGHLIENVLKNKDYQYAFLRYLKNYNIKDFNFQQDIKSELHLKLEANSASPLTLFLSTLIEKNLNDEQEYTPKFLFEEYCAYLKEAKFHFEDNIKTFLFNLTELYKIKYAKKYEKTSLKLLISRKELKEVLTVKFKVNFDEIDGGVVNVVEEDREKIINKALIDENNELKKQIEELKLLLTSRPSQIVCEPAMELIIAPIIDNDDISVLTESTTQSNKKIKKVLKFKPESLEGLTDKEVVEFLSVEKVGKFSKESQKKANEIIQACEVRLTHTPKREYKDREISEFVLNKEKLDYLTESYNEYDDKSKLIIDEIIKELTFKVNKTKAFESNDSEAIALYTKSNDSIIFTPTDLSVESSLIARPKAKVVKAVKEVKAYKSRKTKKDKEMDLDSMEL